MKTIPYGKSLEELQQQNLILPDNIFIVIGKDAWSFIKGLIKNFPHSLCLPPFHSSLNYYWPVNKCDIFIIDTGRCSDSYVEELILRLFFFDANIVLYSSLQQTINVFKKDF